MPEELRYPQSMGTIQARHEYAGWLGWLASALEWCGAWRVRILLFQAPAQPGPRIYRPR